ncbi:hypothetical protein DFQ28_004036 [Apophysomyces sp. BC1034]|nr:hypothetical protein DFQ30_011129 [Apophysomyces sp. BC1015]KAG0189003.1 hypothetical protein DFQ28_004036 [Apophysomyces sp. BC1034]
MTESDLDEVAALERDAYEFSWTRGNFEDSLRNGYFGVCMRHVTGALIGYCVLMPVVDEMHLLNLCVAPVAQGRGAGLALLREAVRITRARRLGSVLLEVRPSNPRAMRLYERFGFVVIGRRKHYYPARHRTREDAIVMRYVLRADADAHEQTDAHEQRISPSAASQPHALLHAQAAPEALDTILDELGIAPLWTRRDAGYASDGVNAVRDMPSPAAGAMRQADARPSPLEPVELPDALSARSEPVVSIGAATAASAVSAVSPDVQPVPMLDWLALKARVAGCTSCRLCERRTNTVFGVGDEAADWMLVGEAPGENEDRQGEPFVGQAGKLLDNMLRALELRRGNNVYIANVLKCRPPGNRNPEPDEVLRCEPYLKRQVELVQPKVIVALGRFAAQSLLKTSASISSLRGRAHEYEGVPVIVTYHPAYLLRSDSSQARRDPLSGVEPAYARTTRHGAVCAYRDVAVRDLAWLLLSPPLLDSQYFGAQLAHARVEPKHRPQTLAWLAALDADPRALHAVLDARPQSRLGLHAEQLLGFFLEHGPAATRLIAANRPVRVDGYTLGECDFLFEDAQGRALHWELALKCYLDVGGPSGSLARYVGPNLADRFDRKLARLLTHQLTLSRHPWIAALAPDGHWQAAMVVCGWLFHRWAPGDTNDEGGIGDPRNANDTGGPCDARHPDTASRPVAPGHARGWWTCATQWPAFDAPAWTIVPRLRWMAPLRLAADDPLVQRDPTAVLARCFEYWRNRPDQPLMVAALAGGHGCTAQGPRISTGRDPCRNPSSGEWHELSRGFIAPDDWPARAAAYAAIP